IREKSSASSPPAPETILTRASFLSNPPPPASCVFRSWYSLSVSCALSLSTQKSTAPIAVSISVMRACIESFDFIRSHLSDLNRRPQLYESCALPTELRWQVRSEYITISIILNYCRSFPHH